jgi:hypothetical protein
MPPRDHGFSGSRAFPRLTSARTRRDFDAPILVSRQESSAKNVTVLFRKSRSSVNLELSPELMKRLILRSNLPVPRKRRVAAPLERAKPPVELMLVDPQLGSDRFGSFAAQANRLELVLRRKL